MKKRWQNSFTEEKTQLMSDSSQKLTELNQQLDTPEKAVISVKSAMGKQFQKQQAQVKKKQQEQAKKLVVHKEKIRQRSGGFKNAKLSSKRSD